MYRKFMLGIDTPESFANGDVGEAWREVVGDRKLEGVIYAEFGLAEETVAMLIFADGSREVGMGESLRPYDIRYQGDNAEEAASAFFLAIAECALGHRVRALLEQFKDEDEILTELLNEESGAAVQ